MERVQPENITSIEQAREIIGKLQSDRDKAYKELNKARAIIYDLTYSKSPEPYNTELKAEVTRLSLEMKECIEKRDIQRDRMNKIKDIVRSV